MEGYEEDKKNYILDGFREGFSIGCTNVNSIKEPKNLKSAYANPSVVDAKLQRELDAGRMIGPFDRSPYPNTIISPIGLHPKKSGDFRLITHLSYPPGLSVNDAIPNEMATVQYATVGHAISIIKSIGKGAYLAKTDIKNAFRIMPIKPSEYRLLGIKWRGSYFIDRSLVMGCSSSCKIFEAFSTALEWVARNKLGIPGIIHILDDYLIIARTKHECLRQLNAFLQFCSDCGIPIAQEKTLGPEQVLPFAGIELDCVRMLARLPDDKLIKCTELIKQTLDMTRISLKGIQELCGLLNFCCIVIYPGRCFLRRLYNLTIGLSNKHAQITLSAETKDDLRMWLRFLSQFNGKIFFMSNKWIAADALNLHSDAAQTGGFAATLQRQWLYGEWPEQMRRIDITTLEFYPIVVALNVWGQSLSDLNINIHTDNESLVSIINSQTVKRNDRCLKLLRIFVLTCLKFNILVKAFHIPGSKNSICDSLSRLQVDRFRELAPAMHRMPTAIPHYLSPEKLLKT